MQKGEISEPIMRQNSILFLKINETRIEKLDKKVYQIYKKNYKSEKTNYSIYTL